MDRKVRLAMIAQAHDKFVRDNLDAKFKPESRPDSEDYNLWNVDMEADDSTFMEETKDL